MRFAEKNGFTSILTVASDTPFFPADLVSKLSNASAKDNALISLAATKQNDKLVRHPTFGLWSVSLADDLKKIFKQVCEKLSYGLINIQLKRFCFHQLNMIHFIILIRRVN